MVASPVQQKLPLSSSSPAAPLLPGHCGHCDLDNEAQKHSFSGGTGGVGGGLTFAHDAIFFSAIRPRTLALIGQLQGTALLPTPV